MDNTRIFVSSTCYDLAAIREMIVDLGHEPFLSEYPSFPVSPDANAIANCRRNVRRHPDILVLIVGGRRGSLDPGTGKPVTNLEYDEALCCGIPIYVFVNRTVNDLLHVWKQNPGTNFAPTVDYPQVFTFIEQIRTAGIWTFPFERTADIKEVLRPQLSGLFRDLLDRRKGGRLDPLPEFAGESKRARELALDKPKFWEFLLTAELLNTKLARVRHYHDDVLAGLVYHNLKALKASEVLDWNQLRLAEIMALVSGFEPAFQTVMSAWGPPGQPGDAVAIKQACERIVDFAKGIVNWEVKILSVRPPNHLKKLVGMFVVFRTGLLEKLNLFHR